MPTPEALPDGMAVNVRRPALYGWWVVRIVSALFLGMPGVLLKALGERLEAAHWALLDRSDDSQRACFEARQHNPRYWVRK